MENLILLIDIGTSFLKGLSFLPQNNEAKILDFFKIRCDPYNLQEFREKLKILFSFFDQKIPLKKTKLIFLSGEGVGFGDIIRINFERESSFSPIKKREFSWMLKVAQEASMKNISQRAKINDLTLIFSDIEKINIDHWQVSYPLGMRGKNIFLQIVNFYFPISLYFIIKKILSFQKIKDFSFYYFPRIFSYLFSQEERPALRSFFDVGGKNTQIFEIHSDVLEFVSEVPFGGDHFTQKIIKELEIKGKIGEEFIEEIKKKASMKFLAPSLQKKIDKILATGYCQWQEAIVQKIGRKFLGSEIYLLGGGSALSVFSLPGGILERKDYSSIIKIINLQAIPLKIEGASGFDFYDPQFTNLLLVAKIISQGKILISKPFLYDVFSGLLY